MRICFVCTGNICRSPTGEGILRHLLAQAGLSGHTIESAGLIDHHVGERPDPRTLRTAEAHGVALPSRARQFLAPHFLTYDLVLALDRTHMRQLQALAKEHGDKVRMLRDFDPLATDADRDVPDPYYSDAAAFERVYAMCLRACTEILRRLQSDEAL